MSEVMDKPEVKAEKAPKAKKVKITIFSGEDKGDKGDVFLQHNYRPILIKRDEPVTVDECYLEVLKHTVIETTVKNEAGEEIAVRIPRYNYSVESV